MQINKEYKLELSDYTNHHEFIHKSAYMDKIKALPLIIIPIAILCIVERRLNIMVLLVGIISCISLLLPNKSNYKKIISGYEASGILDIIHTLKIDVNGISEKVSLDYKEETGEFFIPYKKVREIAESEHGMYIKSFDKLFIVPKRHFTDYEIDEIKEIFKENIPKRKLKFLKNK